MGHLQRGARCADVCLAAVVRMTPAFKLFIYSDGRVAQLQFTIRVLGGAGQSGEAGDPRLKAGAHSAGRISPRMEILQKDVTRQTVTVGVSEQAISPPFNKQQKIRDSQRRVCFLNDLEKQG